LRGENGSKLSLLIVSVFGLNRLFVRGESFNWGVENRTNSLFFKKKL